MLGQKLNGFSKYFKNYSCTTKMAYNMCVTYFVVILIPRLVSPNAAYIYLRYIYIYTDKNQINIYIIQTDIFLAQGTPKHKFTLNPENNWCMIFILSL